MTSKKGNAVRLETEIEKCREDCRWARVIELAQQLKQGSPNQEALADFLLGEGKLESFLEEHPPVESNSSKANSGLAETKKYLLRATSDLGKKVRQDDRFVSEARVALDGNLLLGKLCYACGRYEEALKYYNNAELDSLTEKELPCRGLKIVAESYAIYGLCLEKTPNSSSSKFKAAEKEERIIKCFELASDLTLLYLQELDRLQQQVQHSYGSGAHSPLPPPPKDMGPILETALQRSPVLLIQAGNLTAAVKRYRSMLSAVESTTTQSLRLTLAKQLAEVLLRGLRGVLYFPPPSVTSKVTTKVNTDSPWKPRQYSSINMFTPVVDQEEIVLLLLVAEEIAVRDTVLSQAPEFQSAKRAALDAVTAIYDLLAVALVRWHQSSLLNEVLERAMKFSFREGHIWTQRALSLVGMGRHFHAFEVLKEAKILTPNDAFPCLLGARICYEFLERPKEGAEWSKLALSRIKENDSLLSRCWLYRGIGFHLQALSTSLKDEKLDLEKHSLEAFTEAQKLDGNDHLVEYYLALRLACQGDVVNATTHARAALNLRWEHAESLQLLAVLQTAQKQYDEAENVLALAHSEYPDNLHIMHIKACLELAMDRAPVALQTAQRMLAVWKEEYDEQTNVDNCNVSDHKSDARSVFQLYTSEMSDKDTGSLHAQSIAASRVEHALSEVASSISSFTPRPGPQRAWLLQAQIWLLLAEIYLEVDQPDSAAACVHEAAIIYPLSHHVLFMRGLIHEHKREFSEARQWYQNAASVNPGYVKSLQHLGLMYHYLGIQRLAEKTLRDAAKLDPRDHNTWYHLGLVLEAVGERESAADCLTTALEVETANPVLPYSSIPLPFQ